MRPVLDDHIGRHALWGRRTRRCGRTHMTATPSWIFLPQDGFGSRSSLADPGQLACYPLVNVSYANLSCSKIQVRAGYDCVHSFLYELIYEWYACTKSYCYGPNNPATDPNLLHQSTEIIQSNTPSIHSSFISLHIFFSGYNSSSSPTEPRAPQAMPQSPSGPSKLIRRRSSPQRITFTAAGSSAGPAFPGPSTTSGPSLGAPPTHHIEGEDEVESTKAKKKRKANEDLASMLNKRQPPSCDACRTRKLKCSGRPEVIELTEEAVAVIPCEVRLKRGDCRPGADHRQHCKEWRLECSYLYQRKRRGRKNRVVERLADEQRQRRVSSMTNARREDSDDGDDGADGDGEAGRNRMQDPIGGSDFTFAPNYEPVSIGLMVSSYSDRSTGVSSSNVSSTASATTSFPARRALTTIASALPAI